MSFICIITFVLGFAMGVYERKVDRIRFKLPLNKKENAEVLITPPQDVLDREEGKEFYDKII